MIKTIGFFRKITFSFLLIPLFLGALPIPASAEKDSKMSPATEEDLFFYRAIGATYICLAREAEIEFSQATGIAVMTYVNLLEGRHDSTLEAIGDKKLTRKELIRGAENQLVPATVEYCPEKVPNKTKKEVKKFLKELKKNKNKR